MHPAANSPCRGGQHDLPVDPGGLAPSVALRHLPHADQRVRPGPSINFCKTADLRSGPLPRRLEDPLPQPPYVVLMAAASPRRPSRERRLRSVHLEAAIARDACPVIVSNLPFGSGGLDRRLQRLTWPTSAPFRVRPPGPYPAGYPQRPAEGGQRPVSCCLSATGIRFLGILFPPGGSASLTVGLPGPQPGPRRGFHVPHARDATGEGALYTPGAAVFPDRHKCLRPPPAASSGQPLHPGTQPVDEGSH